MKSLDDLKNGKVIPFAKYMHNGRSVSYHPETPYCFKHYKCINEFGGLTNVKTKKTAIKFLEAPF